MQVKFLFSILASVIHGTEIKLPDRVDWQVVYLLSYEHGVAAVVFDKVQELYAKHGDALRLPMELKLQWYSLQCQTEKQNAHKHKTLYKVVSALNESGLHPILLKGVGLAGFYPNPLHRATGDIDLLFRHDEYPKAKALFEEQGWFNCPRVHEDLKHLDCTVDSVMIELHNYSTIIPGIKANKYYQKWIDNALAITSSGFFVNESGDTTANSGSLVRILPLEQNLVYTFIHAFFHFISEGLSLRQVVDYALLLKRYKNEEIQVVLSNTGFLNAWQVFGCLLVKYLGFSTEEVPCYDARYEKKAEKVMNVILSEAEKRAVRVKPKNLFVKYITLCKSHFRCFGLFPKECLGFLLRLFMNTFTKYAKLGEPRRGGIK